MKLALHHVALGAKDVVRLAEFYERAFGLPRKSSFEDGVGIRSIWLGIGTRAVLMIERTNLEKPRREGVDAGPFLLAFACEETELEAGVARLSALGSVLESRSEFSRYFRDPEGNRIALSAYPLGPSEES